VSEPIRPEHPRIRGLLTPDFKAVLWGDLSSLHVTELVAVLSQGRKTGMLLVEREGAERLFGFVDGEVVSAFHTGRPESEPQDASATLLGLLEKPGGTFTFLRGPAGSVPKGFPALSTQEVVLEALRRLDESKRLAG
jgi:hypothetical protein